MTSLLLAVEKENIDIVRLLMQNHKIDVNLRSILNYFLNEILK